MSFFRGGGAFDDPFFGDIHRMMRNQMRELDSLMVDPFGFMGGRVMDEGRYRSPRQQMIDDNGATSSNIGHGHRGARDSAMVQRDPMSSMLDSFGFGFGGGLFGGLMRQMDQMQAQAFNDPNSHVFSQSTVISMRPGQDGRPEYYEQTESVRKAGDVKETRKSVRDTERGVEEMKIGHHIGNRGHVIEKRRDRTTGGQILENQEFIGLKEDEAEKFDREWSHATRKALSGERFLLDDESNASPHLAIEDSRSQRRNHMASPYARRPAKDSRKHRNQAGPAFRVEEPDETKPKQEKKKERKGGPKIVELD